MASPVQNHNSAYSAFAYIDRQFFERIVKNAERHIDHKSFKK